MSIDRFDDANARKIQDLADAMAERMGRIEIENANMRDRLKELGEWDALIEDGSVHEHLVAPQPDDLIGRLRNLLNHDDVGDMPMFFSTMKRIHRDFTMHYGHDVFEEDYRIRGIYALLCRYFKALGVWYLLVYGRSFSEPGSRFFEHIKSCASWEMTCTVLPSDTKDRLSAEEEAEDIATKSDEKNE